MRGVAEIKAHIVALCLNCVYVFGTNQKNSLPILDSESFTIPSASFEILNHAQEPSCVRLFCPFHKDLGLVYSLREAFPIERFRQIVDGVYVESTNGVLIICSNKNDYRKALSIEVLQHIEPVEVGHLYIQKDEVWIMFLNRINCLSSISRFRNYFNLRMVFEHLANSIACEWFIVNN